MKMFNNDTQSQSHALFFYFRAWFYILVLIGLLFQGNIGSIASWSQFPNRSEANIRRNQSLAGAKGSVSHIYHKDSPSRPPNCDDECIHEVRINKTLQHMDLRRRSMKLPGWRGVVNSGYWVRSMAAEWYTTFIVGSVIEGARDQVVEVTLDTGSPFTWFQCMPCLECFPQKIRVYVRKKSTTYRRLNENDPYCTIIQNFPNIGIGATPEVCRYRLYYADITSSRGVVAEEWFKLQSTNAQDNGQILALGPLGFGCGFENTAAIKSGSSGILGLSNSRTGLSFPEQLAPAFGAMFGYCLTPLNEPADSGYIIFGKASTPTGAYPSTPFLYTDSIYYYVDLVDMSVNDQLLNVPPGTFDRDTAGQGGTVVDSGAPYSFLPTVAFDLLITALTQVFNQLGAPYYPDRSPGIVPCWGTKDFDKDTFPFPKVAWHFRDGNILELSTSGTYVLYKTNSHLTSLCVPFVQDRSRPPALTVIGGHSQINTYMFFEQNNQRLAWIYNAC
ncbi:hypothetical protein Mapa_015545 [Marchantia paleacea]|nr:hypothetical protein Mapa_015545 [Marchantia paleacea]